MQGGVYSRANAENQERSRRGKQTYTYFTKLQGLWRSLLDYRIFALPNLHAFVTISEVFYGGIAEAADSGFASTSHLVYSTNDDSENKSALINYLALDCIPDML